ncbi:MAG: SidA/IucD/PvdA family monooxygenase, partial [Patulibacter sp.]
MTDNEILDVVGVGLGPFNLGLAALLDGVDDVRAVFLDQRAGFDWHPGLLLDDAEIQVPFLADLVTMADPTSRHSFLNYLHEHGRLYRFYFHERFQILRREFQHYGAWVAGRLPGCRFGRRVVDVRPHVDGGWTVEAAGPDGGAETYRTRQVVFGVGTVATLPACAAAHVDRGTTVSADGTLLHSGDYVPHRAPLHAAPSVTVVGGGESAAEIVLDLLQHAAPETRIDWVTRGLGFLSMEYGKLGLEHFTPEYVDHFHALDPDRRDALRDQQDLLYKGISTDTQAAIYDALYRRTAAGGEEPRVAYRARTEVREVVRDGDGWWLTLRHRDEQAEAELPTSAVVFATGYAAPPLPLDAALIATDDAGRPDVSRDYRLRGPDGAATDLFVQNAELHSHGVGTPDLGMATYRNAVLVNAIAGRPVYAVPERTVFQRFGLGDLREAGATPATARGETSGPADDAAARGETS